jgi:DMSO reductase anchor subunit
MSHVKGPPPEDVTRARDAERPQPPGRDITPAVGTRGAPGRWRRAVEGAAVALQRPRFEDGRWSFLYDKGTRYAADAASADGRVAEAARRMRGGEQVPVEVRGPVINAAVWTWEVPLYFWFGGIATGSSFAAVACDAAGDHRSAQVARLVSTGAVGLGAPLLILDLGRPLRFLNMFRIFKTRSPMSMGAWCLMGFANLMGAAVAADLLRRPRIARLLGVQAAVLGTYLGSYTGVLLAGTAVPVWGRSRRFLPAIFMCTAAATGSAATRLTLAATGLRPGHPTLAALGTVETVAMGAELALSSVNERRLGRLREGLEHGRPGKLFTFARWAVRGGLALRAAERRQPWVHHVASVLYLLAGLAFRFGWVGAGRTSARDHEAVALMARQKGRPSSQPASSPSASR